MIVSKRKFLVNVKKRNMSDKREEKERK